MEIKTDNLYAGQKIRNYKELCEIMGLEQKGGCSRNSQLQEIERYISYTKQQHAFIIKEVYNKPKPKTIVNRNSVYSKYAQKLILDLLAQQHIKGDKKVFLSTCKLFKELNMINDNYIYGKRNIPELANYLDMSEDYVYEFYNYTDKSLKSIVESALKALQNKALIMWGIKAIVCVTKYINEDDKENKVTELREATDLEIDYILKAERDVLEHLELQDKSSVVLHRKWDEFITRVNMILKEYNIDYYYKAYSINFHTDVVKENEKLEKEIKNILLEESNRSNERSTLNNKIMQQFSNNIDNRADSIHNENNKITNTKTLEIRKSEEYVDNNKKLLKTTIKTNEDKINESEARKLYNKKQKEKEQQKLKDDAEQKQLLKDLDCINNKDEDNDSDDI